MTYGINTFGSQLLTMQVCNAKPEFRTRVSGCGKRKVKLASKLAKLVAGVLEKWLWGFLRKERIFFSELFVVYWLNLLNLVEVLLIFGECGSNSRLAFVVMQTSEMTGLHFLFSAVWRSAAGTKQGENYDFFEKQSIVLRCLKCLRWPSTASEQTKVISNNANYLMCVQRYGASSGKH